MKLNEEIQKRPDNMFLQVLSKMSGKVYCYLMLEIRQFGPDNDKIDHIGLKRSIGNNSQ